MAGEFGKFIDEKRRGRGPDGGDILLKDIAKAMGATPTYLSDIVKGRRNSPEMSMLRRESFRCPGLPAGQGADPEGGHTEPYRTACRLPCRRRRPCKSFRFRLRR